MESNSESLHMDNSSEVKNHDDVTGLTNELCQRIIAMLSRKLASVNATTHLDITQIGNHFISPSNYGLFKSNFWILDSRATSHVCNNKDIFFNMRKVCNTRIRLPNQLIIPVEEIGDIKLNKDLLLHDVLFVPQFALNLVSVTSLTIHEKGLMVELYHDYANIKQIFKRTVIGKGKVKDGLYLLQDEEMEAHVFFPFLSNNDTKD